MDKEIGFGEAVLTYVSKQQIIDTAQKEVQEERFREAVEKEKDRIRAGKWYDRLLPFTIEIKRKTR